MRLSIRSSILAAVLALPACAAGASDARPATDLGRYARLISLRSAGFSCVRATRPGGTWHPRHQRLYDATWDLQEEIRQVLIRREGEARVVEVENPEVEHYSPTSAPCSVTAADRARERYRGALYEMRKRLGLPRTAARTGPD